MVHSSARPLNIGRSFSFLWQTNAAWLVGRLKFGALIGCATSCCGAPCIDDALVDATLGGAAFVGATLIAPAEFNADVHSFAVKSNRCSRCVICRFSASTVLWRASLAAILSLG